MSKQKMLTRGEYEVKVNKHLDAIRLLTKRFNPEIRHISMAIVGNYQWANAWAGEDHDSQVKVSDFVVKFAKDENGDSYFERKPVFGDTDYDQE